MSPCCVLLPNVGKVPSEQQALELAVLFWGGMANISCVGRFSVPSGCPYEGEYNTSPVLLCQSWV